nr:DUF5819 family protein [Pseudenhygromyxa sp. WMMC2535]
MSTTDDQAPAADTAATAAADATAESAPDPAPAPAPAPCEPRPPLPRIVTCLGLLALAFHFTVTAIYINPISVIGLAWSTEINAYLEPLFRQRWSLFAPNPPMLDRRLDYQCEVDGRPGEWLSRSEGLLETHARRRFSPAARLRRLETAAIVATVGSQDLMLEQLVAAQDDASEETRGRVQDALAQRVAASIVSSETAYRLVLAYCRQDLGHDPERMRYRVVTSAIKPFSERESPTLSEAKGMTMPWLAPDEFDVLEQRAIEYLEVYEQQKRAEAERQPDSPTPEAASAASEGAQDHD